MFAGADLRSANLAGARFHDCIFTGADFRNANCRFAVISGSDLTGADFRGAELYGNNFHDAKGANLYGAKGAPIQFQAGAEYVYIQGGQLTVAGERIPLETLRNLPAGYLESVGLSSWWSQWGRAITAVVEAQAQRQ
jgi:hypothetical protein